MNAIDVMQTYITTRESALASGKAVDVIYTNYRGDRLVRRIEPQRIWFGATDWHQEPQWLMDVFDIDRGAVRTFAMRDIEAFDHS